MDREDDQKMSQILRIKKGKGAEGREHLRFPPTRNHVLRCGTSKKEKKQKVGWRQWTVFFLSFFLRSYILLYINFSKYLNAIQPAAGLSPVRVIASKQERCECSLDWSFLIVRDLFQTMNPDNLADR